MYSDAFNFRKFCFTRVFLSIIDSTMRVYNFSQNNTANIPKTNGVYNFKSIRSYSNPAFKRNKNKSNFTAVKDILNSQSNFAFQILGVLILTIAVFLGTQGIFSGTSVSTKAQISDSKDSVKVITNFETKSPVGQNTNLSNLKEII